jgi:hypothetical protein
MAYDTGLAQILREALTGLPVTEKKMMGGLSFLLNGHMLCGVHKNGALFRVGKPNYQTALTIPGAGPMTFTGRPMSGFVDVTDETCADDTRRGQLLALALGFVQTLPAK